MAYPLFLKTPYNRVRRVFQPKGEEYSACLFAYQSLPTLVTKCYENIFSFCLGQDLNSYPFLEAAGEENTVYPMLLTEMMGSQQNTLHLSAKWMMKK